MLLPKKKKKKPRGWGGKSAPSTHIRNEDSGPLLLRDQKCGSARDPSLPGPWPGAPPDQVATAGLPGSEGPIPTAARRGRPRARVLRRKRSPAKGQSDRPWSWSRTRIRSPSFVHPSTPATFKTLTVGSRWEPWGHGVWGEARGQSARVAYPLPQRVGDLGFVCYVKRIYRAFIQNKIL